MTGVQGSRSGRPRRAAVGVTLTAVLLSVALTGCGGRAGSGTQNSGTTQHTSSGTSGSAAQPEGSGQAGDGSATVDQQTADQIEGAVNDAQSELDGLDHDFAGDDGATN